MRPRPLSLLVVSAVLAGAALWPAPGAPAGPATQPVWRIGRPDHDTHTFIEDERSALARVPKPTLIPNTEPANATGIGDALPLG